MSQDTQHVSIEIIERQGTNHLPLIVEKLNERFLRTKARNPRGFRDQFDEQQDTHLLEVAQELGGVVEFKDDGTVLFKFL